MGIESDFPAAQRSIYLNAASVALMPRVASDHAEAWQRDIAENGTLNFDEVAEDKVFDDLRAVFGRLVGAAANDIAVASSASEFIASIAWAVMPPAKSRIVTTDIIFPSTAYPWARVARHTGAEMHYVGARNGVIDEDELIAAIDDRTSVVSICHVEYSTGQRLDLKRIGAATRKVGAFLLVDASQSAGAVPIDVQREPVDALVTTSYKWLCGPFGVGLAYVAPQWQTRLDPGLTGWRSHGEVYDLRAERCVYHNDARRFEFSTMAYGCAGALAKGIEYVSAIGVPGIFASNLALIDRLLQGIAGLGIDVVSPMSSKARSSIVSIKCPGLAPKVVIQALSKRKIIASPRRDYVRFSPHLYNTTGDVDVAGAALRDVMTGARRGTS